MDTDIKPFKGILKQALHGPDGPAEATFRKKDPKELALQHARILQQRKDLEAQILDSLILLSEYPATQGRHPASDPAPSDVAGFKTHVRLFQPGDFEDLIEERNANKLCGYTLCAKPKPQPSRGGPWKLMNVGSKDFGIVDRKEMERWCSQDCKRRALYVKVQLSETAAWERAGIPDIEIELMGEAQFTTKDSVSQATEAVGHLTLNDRKPTEDMAALALERGDNGTATAPGTVTLTIREKEVAPPVEPDSDEEDSEHERTAHMLIEGHKPGRGKAKAHEEAIEDAQDA
ncbi:RNA polymerase II subunit B1 CTD phosphatase RTR1 like protein [Verticillium longisporum]|nr:RNA polymerase II subunit B1 CTD phosphatase RTR1 like protein [Verticillium longisporum]